MSDVHVGFTGTQDGLTMMQSHNLARYMRDYREALEPDRALILHHGDCIGADYQAHIMAYGHGWQVELHPGTDGNGESPKRKHSENSEFRHVRAIHEPCPYAERNMDIVLSGMILLACPGGPEKRRSGTRRSGTWATIRAAERMARMVIVFYPDGDIEMRNEDMEHGHE